MGKSIRSKRKRRLRTLKREIVEPYYDRKGQPKMVALAAALAAPKVEIPKKQEEMETVPVRGRSRAPEVTPMSVDTAEAEKNSTDSRLKAKGGIGKRRGKSRKRDVSSKRKKQVKF